jgi:hypothetical protein
MYVTTLFGAFSERLLRQEGVGAQPRARRQVLRTGADFMYLHFGKKNVFGHN